MVTPRGSLSLSLGNWAEPPLLTRWGRVSDRHSLLPSRTPPASRISPSLPPSPPPSLPSCLNSPAGRDEPPWSAPPSPPHSLPLSLSFPLSLSLTSPSQSSLLSFPLQSELGYGKLQTYSKLEKLGEVSRGFSRKGGREGSLTEVPGDGCVYTRAKFLPLSLSSV